MLFCTVAGRAQRAGAIVLARSVKQHHPHSRFVLCLVECYVPPEAAEPFDDIVVVGATAALAIRTRAWPQPRRL